MFHYRDEQDLQIIRSLQQDPHYLPLYGLSIEGVILDLGCWIGFTTLQLNLSYPECTILACEPNAENYYLAHLNIKRPAPIILSNVAIGKGLKKLLKSSNNMRSLTSDMHGDGDEIEVMTVDELLFKWNLHEERIGFCKMDIEGSEVEALEGQWLSRTDIINIDLHGTGEEVRRILKRNNFQVKTYRPSLGCPDGHIIGIRKG